MGRVRPMQNERFDTNRRIAQAALLKQNLAEGGYVIDEAGATVIRVLADLLTEACQEIDELREALAIRDPGKRSP